MKSKGEPKNLVKIAFHLEPDAGNGAVTETVWAEALGSDRYRLKNSPFYATDVSFEDVVIARESDGALVFASVPLRGGHSTYRIVVAQGMESRFPAYWSELQRLGCSYEGAPGRLYSVDVPSASDLSEVHARLDAGEGDEVWTFEESHRGHITTGAGADG